jgi:hypothetical protein
MHVSPGWHSPSALHVVLEVAGEVSVHSRVGSPDVPAGHLHLKVPTAFSQKAPTPHGDALHSSMSMQARWGRFYETVSAGIYGQNLKWVN